MSTLKSVYKKGDFVLEIRGSLKLKTPDPYIFIGHSPLNVNLAEAHIFENVEVVKVPVGLHTEDTRYIISGRGKTEDYTFDDRSATPRGILFSLGSGDCLLVMYNCELSWEDRLSLIGFAPQSCVVFAETNASGLTGNAIGVPILSGFEGYEIPFSRPIQFGNWSMYEEALSKQNVSEDEEVNDNDTVPFEAGWEPDPIEQDGNTDCHPE